MCYTQSGTIGRHPFRTLVHVCFSYFQVNPAVMIRTAHASGTDTSCLCYSYDGRTLASRGGNANLLPICSCLLNAAIHLETAVLLIVKIVCSKILKQILLFTHIFILLVWPTSWTPAVGGLIVCVRVCVSLCVRRHVAILLGA